MSFVFTPRWYQGESVSATFDFLENKPGNPLIALPTGTGKSWIPAMMMYELLRKYPTLRMSLITHVQELVEQDLEKLKLLWPLAPVGVYCAGLGLKEGGHPLTFGTIGSMARNPAAFARQDLIIVDEAHMISPKGTTLYQKLFDYLRKINPKLRIVGLTATYYRMGSGLLTDEGQIFDDFSYNQCGIDAFNRFVDEGFLAPLIPKPTDEEINTDDVAVRMGDFAAKQLEAAANDSDLTLRIVKEIIVKGKSRNQWLSFCTSIDHAEKVAHMMTDNGVPTRAIHSKMSNADVTRLLRDFRDGKIKSLTNKDKLTTGHDFPRLDLINMLRPTQSAALWVQMLGRGTRPSPATGKENCIVLDFANNTQRLGPINDPIIPKRRKRGGNKGEAPIYICQGCQTFIHASVRTCPHCGTEREFINAEEKLAEKASGQQLIRKSKKVKQEPIVGDFEVDKVTYNRHSNPYQKTKPDSLRIDFHCGLRVFSKWVFFESQHAHFRSEAYKWWESRSLDGALEVPKTIDEVIEHGRLGNIRAEKFIRVWTNKKPHAEVLNYAFD